MKSEEDARAAEVERLRPRLMGLAYRMLGSATDAEDAVQDAYVKFQEVGGIESPDAWLVKTTTRICIDRLRKTKRRAEYQGPWLPEPIAETWEEVAPDRFELVESLSMAFLVLLETLSPAERAAYVLREVFHYEFDEIAELLGKTAVNVRQITTRAKRRLGQGERRNPSRPDLAKKLADRFFEACRAGDIEAIESLLADDAVYVSDGGGVVPAAPKPLHGRHRIANLLSVVFRKRQKICTLTACEVNEQPGIVFTRDGIAIQVLTFAEADGRVGKLFSVLNPDKLHRWTGAAFNDSSHSFGQ